MLVEAISIFLLGVFGWFVSLYAGVHIFFLIRTLVEKWQNRK